MINTVLKTEMI